MKISFKLDVLSPKGKWLFSYVPQSELDDEFFEKAVFIPAKQIVTDEARC